ncbi:Flp family type IVb pilin [Mitsuokella jalaludinii]|uniref:Flp pilus assembly protein, pilin Flp n=1 Tax=Mitsuokella jalaludinii TaxID=187979 RepID=A0A174AP67_9FIRM|nr:hypothetical protein [Mitsuokella jalaludinii]CUN89215.1 Uncharacterised protein [Mitsuokella jalaludinii]
MGRQKGQGIVEYALILAFVVGIGGVLFANGNLADSIRSVFSNVNTLIEEASKPPLAAATTAKDIIERLRQGRYDGLADELQGKPSKTLEITSDSEKGQELAKKLNIKTKPGDAWFVRVTTHGHTVFTYYSADANGGQTYGELKEMYNSNPSNYYTKDKGNAHSVKIDEGNYNGTGSGRYYSNVPGYVGPSPDGNGMIIDPTPTNKL